MRSLIAIAAMGVLLIGGLFATAPASAAVGADNVKSITIEGGDSDHRSKLVIKFPGAGLSKSKASGLRHALTRGQVRNQRLADVLQCGQKIGRMDNNGYFSIALYCGAPGTSTLPWGYKISPELRAIITGLVAERGMAWWQNGQARPWNAPHVVSPDYQFHGTLGPVWWGDDIDYNDFYVFRVNVGGQTGTGTLTTAGTVQVRQ
ncbi:hypothetical protein ACH35V_24195 [Actinomadura sp. 1N219]|uniref:hypothetical protein n=1 Tax=Actinomadura sp. 1N219 TaxID=3375152 RepID=UPI003798E64E